ncbi:hypothetical protein RRG08_061262 [Elysia crispata]|uniref:Uncharacterized protein n=1 Tax=Elysia crispata TaxID=231223 RepID=A0AAE0ZG23_9GAST|nr:hypothetical protein RRG08_061262 [Elysia crispata]
MELFQSAASPDESTMEETKVVSLMKRINTTITTSVICQKLKELEIKRVDGKRGRLSSEEFIALFKEISTRPEIYFLLVRYASNADYMSTDDLLLFLEAEQGVRLALFFLLGYPQPQHFVSSTLKDAQFLACRLLKPPACDLTRQNLPGILAKDFYPNERSFRYRCIKIERQQVSLKSLKPISECCARDAAKARPLSGAVWRFLWVEHGDKKGRETSRGRVQTPEPCDWFRFPHITSTDARAVRLVSIPTHHEYRRPSRATGFDSHTSRVQTPEPCDWFRFPHITSTDARAVRLVSIPTHHEYGRPSRATVFDSHTSRVQTPEPCDWFRFPHITSTDARAVWFRFPHITSTDARAVRLVSIPTHHEYRRPSRVVSIPTHHEYRRPSRVVSIPTHHEYRCPSRATGFDSHTSRVQTPEPCGFDSHTSRVQTPEPCGFDSHTSRVQTPEPSGFDSHTSRVQTPEPCDWFRFPHIRGSVEVTAVAGLCVRCVYWAVITD